VAKAGPRLTVGPPGQRPKSAPVRQALVTAAIDVLGEAGFAGASAREIAARAGCSQASVFYHFGSVSDLLLAALDEVSAVRMAAYRTLLDEASSVTALVDSAREIFLADLDAGYVRVLVEMITAAQAVPGLGPQVTRRLEPWREFAETAVRRAIGRSPLSRVLPATDAAHAVVAGFLGLELLAILDGDRTGAIALFDRARALARLLDVTGGLWTPASRRDEQGEGDRPR
jgi:AcrR family transcriptional regulator